MPHRHLTVPSLVALVFAALAASTLHAGETGLVSTMELMAAVSSHDGISVVPADGIPSNRYTGDYSPSQVLEIIRPDQGPISVGRLATSCTCLSASIPKRDFAQGERALIEVRNIKATPPAGATYAVFVQLTSPVKTALEYDMFVKSQSQPIQETQTPKAPQAVPAPAAAPQPQAAAPATVTSQPVRVPHEQVVVIEGEPVVVSRTITVIEHPPIQPPPFTYDDIARYAPKPRAVETPKPAEEPDPEAVVKNQ